MNKIKYIRQRLGLSQQAFGDKLGLDRSYICLLENDKRAIGRNVIQKIKDFMPEIDTNIFFL